MNDYFTFFYVKHFELPMCMKCAIQINLPCLALPCLALPRSRYWSGVLGGALGKR